MATVTEKDIISHLKEKIRFHQQEVKKIENLLGAFTGNTPKEDVSKNASRSVTANTKVAAASAASVKKKPAVQKSGSKQAAKEMEVSSEQVTPKRGSSKASFKKESPAAKAPVADNSQQVSTPNAGQTKIAAKTDQSKGSKNKPAKPAQTRSKNKPAASADAVIESSEKGSKHLAIPAEYDDKMTINAKIAFALNEIGEGYNEDIANAMALYEPRSDAKRLGKQISGVLSTLKNKGYLTAKREGRKDKFALVK